MGFFGWARHYFGWVGVSVALFWVGGALFWVSGGAWVNIWGGLGWVGMSGGEWE